MDVIEVMVFAFLLMSLHSLKTSDDSKSSMISGKKVTVHSSLNSKSSLKTLKRKTLSQVQFPV